MAGIASLAYDSPRPIVVEGTVRSVEGYDAGFEGWLYRVTVDVTGTLEGPELDTLTFSAGTGDCSHIQGERFKVHDRLLVSAAGQSGEPDGFLEEPLIWRYEWGDTWSVHGFTDLDRDSLPRPIRDATTHAEILALVAPDQLPYRMAPDAWSMSIRRPSSDQRLHHLVSWRGGFVALGGTSVGDGGPAAYLSPSIRLSDDGDRWRLVASPFPEADDQSWHVARLVGFRDALYAIGRHGQQLVVWRSDDGRRWSRVRGQPAFGVDAFPRFGDHVPLVITGAAADAARLVVTADAAYDLDPGHPVVWTTTDGRRWERSIPTGLTGGYLQDLTPGPSGFIARVCRCSSPTEQWLLVGSPDGVTWRTLGGLPSFVLDVAFGPALARYYTAALDIEQDGRTFAALYSSTDGSTWTRLLRGPTDAANVAELAVAGKTLVLIGDGYGGTNTTMWAMVSRDSGMTWSFSVLPRSRRDSCETRTVAGPAIVTIGTCDRTLAWVGFP